MKKTLITGGDSFADNSGKNTWPTFLKEKLKFENSIDTGLGATGNKFIKMRLMYEITNYLINNKPEDLFVVVTWSGPNRNCFFVYNEDINLVPDHEWSINPNNFDKSSIGKWVLINHHWSFKLNKIYYEHIENEHNSLIETLHHIHDLQNFLNINKIDYIMTTSWNIIDNIHHSIDLKTVGTTNIGDSEKLLTPETKWIRDLIDWSKFIPITGQWEWTNARFLDKNGPDAHHPFRHEHELFVDEVMIPFITEKY